MLPKKVEFTIEEKNVGAEFGPLFQFEMVYFGKMQDTGECITVE